jgi:hypothetical protein
MKLMPEQKPIARALTPEEFEQELRKLPGDIEPALKMFHYLFPPKEKEAAPLPKE